MAKETFSFEEATAPATFSFEEAMGTAKPGPSANPVEATQDEIDGYFGSDANGSDGAAIMAQSKPKKQSVLDGVTMQAPAGMGDDVDLAANRAARDRSVSPKSVMFTKANAADKADRLVELGKQSLERQEVAKQDIRDAETPEMTAKSVAQDVYAGAGKIIPTFAKGVTDIASLATGGAIGHESSQAIQSYMDGVGKEYASERSRVQKSKFELDMADPNVSITDAVLNNKGALSDQILPTWPAWHCPWALRVWLVSSPPPQRLPRVPTRQSPDAHWQGAGGRSHRHHGVAKRERHIQHGARQGRHAGRRYMAAGITAPFTAAAGKLTGGGAEMALARRLYSGRFATAAGTAKEIVGAGAKEFAQESGEQLGQSLGEAIGTGEPIDLKRSARRSPSPVRLALLLALAAMWSARLAKQRPAPQAKS